MTIGISNTVATGLDTSIQGRMLGGVWRRGGRVLTAAQGCMFVRAGDVLVAHAKAAVSTLGGGGRVSRRVGGSGGGR